ncbi:hypothetical protein AU106_gp073 [Sinorhizobium phage phiM9]|uniref:Uncharacterized protein n=1 Tax=Sinorhizobium phage phiM9 TaxID=1636182 RepID=A0A0F6TH32_9CAUD|nr:hypothetical protein AU106_gp073 [Sinorhizobium phage phiM9]AKE44704.1 hypothetical protein Sm_phiM9_074 [Sinorhizobium phage phiM9]
MSLSSIIHRKQAKDEIIKAIDKRLMKMLEHADLDMKYALIEQRNRVAKIFGHANRGLQSYLNESDPGTNGSGPEGGNDNSENIPPKVDVPESDAKESAGQQI